MIDRGTVDISGNVDCLGSETVEHTCILMGKVKHKKLMIPEKENFRSYIFEKIRELGSRTHMEKLVLFVEQGTSS